MRRRMSIPSDERVPQAPTQSGPSGAKDLSRNPTVVCHAERRRSISTSARNGTLRQERNKRKSEPSQFDSFASDSASTSAPRAISSSDAYSSGRWLYPLRQG